MGSLKIILNVICIVTSILLSALSVQAQDLHLTQYYTSNLSLNPAFTGFYKGDIRVTANIRSQWWQIAAPIRTNMFSAEKKITNHSNEFGFGFILLDDYSSVFKLHTDKLFLSGSFQKKINKHQLRLGIQAGMVLKKTELGTVPSQWDYNTGDFDRSLPTGESFNNQKLFADINMGAGYSTYFNKTRLTAGYAVFHLNRPTEDFISNGRKLPFRHVFSAMVTHNLNPTVAVIPHFLYMNTVKTNDILGGINLKKQLKKDFGVLIGAGYRTSQINSDAAIATAGFNYNRFEFGASMDFTISQLNQAPKNKSAIEFSIIYTTPAKTVDKITIPCDRY